MTIGNGVVYAGNRKGKVRTLESRAWIFSLRHWPTDERLKVVEKYSVARTYLIHADGIV